MKFQKQNAGYKPAYKKHMVVPAQPGYYALDHITLDNEQIIDIKKEAIQAWVVSIYENKDGIITCMEPVTHEARSSSYEDAILYPDGRVVISGVQGWASLEDYSRHINSKRHGRISTLKLAG